MDSSNTDKRHDRSDPAPRCRTKNIKWHEVIVTDHVLFRHMPYIVE
jgi:hypothetical protein